MDGKWVGDVTLRKGSVSWKGGAAGIEWHTSGTREQPGGRANKSLPCSGQPADN